MGKARTRAAKRKSRQGRPKLPAQPREQNGRLSRRIESRRERDMEQLAENPNIVRRIREARILPYRNRDGRMVSPIEQAQNPLRGYTLGLLLLDRRITQEQHDAGENYARLAAAYYGLTGIPFPSARAQNLFAVRGGEGEEREDRVKATVAVRARAKHAVGVLLAVGDINTGRKVAHAVNEVCVLDNIAARTWPEPMLNLLRRGLNALHSDIHRGY